MKEQLWEIYHKEMPEFLREFAEVPPMRRLREIGMNCGCEYTSFPLFAKLAPYSRYDHSIGVALIVWHFTGSMEQALAGLFHDVTTPAFAHVVDFLNGDHLQQESTETGTVECLAASEDVCRLLAKYHLTVEQVSDYHRYPIADNASPALSADRLEYTLGNLLNYGFADLSEIRAFYEDLIVGENETGAPELQFRNPATAAAFTAAALRTAGVYIADEDRFAMQALADLLRLALQRGVLTGADLLTTEPQVIEKLETDPVCKTGWNHFCRYSRILHRCEKPETGYWIQVRAKKRWIDPLVSGLGRVSEWDETVCAQLKAFRAQKFSIWLGAEE